MSLDRPRPHSWRSPRVPRRKPRPSWRAVPPLTRIVIPRARRAGGGLRGFAWRFGGPPRGPQLANLEHRARRIGTVAVGAPMASAKSWVTGAPDHYRGGLDYGQEGVDLAVRYGDGKWPGVRAERLFREELFPVCAPKLRDGGPPLEAPEDLGRHTMIHVIGEPENWRM